MKGYTSLSQSKRLAEILPIESADMWWNFYSVTTDDTTPQIIHLDTPWVGSFNWDNKPDNVPCWSLVALLSVLPDEITDNGDVYRNMFFHLKGKYIIQYPIHKSDNEFYRLEIDKGYNDYAIWYSNNGLTVNDLDVTFDNFVDACVEMIIKLHEQNLL